MDEDNILLNIKCYSEITHDYIGCGVYVSPMDLSADEISTEDIDDLLEDIDGSLEESFWELLSDFENSAQKAFENGVISGTNLDELFKVFGHFHFLCTVDDEPVNIDLEIDPDEYMYPLLVEYLEINEE